MARKLTFALALFVLATLLTGASFATVVPTQITFGPNTTGSITVGTTQASFNGGIQGISGYAWQANRPQGSFNLSSATLVYTNGNSPYTFGPNSQAFTVSIGPDTITGWLSVQALYINAKYGFFAGAYQITTSTQGFINTGFAPGAVVDIDFVTYNGSLSSGEINPGAPVPEPGTIAMVGSGLLAAAGMLRRKFKA
jgi:hypothetical protein